MELMKTLTDLHASPRRAAKGGPHSQAKTLAFLFCLAGLVALPDTARADGTLTCNNIIYSDIGSTGDSNIWTFTANAGDGVIVRLGAQVLTGTNSLDALMLLYNPAGTLVAQNGDYGDKALDVSMHATNSGTYRLVV